MDRPSVYDFAGGEDAFLALATAHHQRCLDDPVLNHPFSHPGHPEHVRRLAEYWGEVFGGPPRYSTTHGTQASMLEMHAGTGGDQELGSRFLECFLQAANDAELPNDPEFRRVLREYMEWATSDVMSYAPLGSMVPSDLAVPHWDWDGPREPG